MSELIPSKLFSNNLLTVWPLGPSFRHELPFSVFMNNKDAVTLNSLILFLGIKM